jgi:hypothetical protein
MAGGIKSNLNEVKQLKYKNNLLISKEVNKIWIFHQLTGQTRQQSGLSLE